VQDMDSGYLEVCGSMLRKILETTWLTPILQNWCNGKYNSSEKDSQNSLRYMKITATVVALCERQRGTAGEDWDMRNRKLRTSWKK